MNDHGDGRSRVCPGCGHRGYTVFFEMRGVPTLVNFLHSTKESALGCPRGDIVLAFCGGCGFIGNVAFDPGKLVYREGYENPLHFSEVFKSYAAALAGELVERFDLRGKTVVEIGCGDGHFLRLLCKLGGNRGIGFDPSYPESLATKSGPVEIVRDRYSEKYSQVDADFIYSRHTLEHVPDPMELLQPLRRSVGDRTDVPVFLEVPNGSQILRHWFVWDIIYEHTSYFTRQSLARVLERAGFRVTRVYEAFSGQYLCAEGFPAESAGGEENGATGPVAGLETDEEIARFVSGYREYLERWKTRLEALRAARKKIVVWGAGSKGVTFVNSFDVGDLVECVVDVNPRKQGMFVAGSGQRIVAPGELTEARPDTVLVVNSVYREEVEETLRSLRLAPEVISL